MKEGKKYNYLFINKDLFVKISFVAKITDAPELCPKCKRKLFAFCGEDFKFKILGGRVLSEDEKKLLIKMKKNYLNAKTKFCENCASTQSGL